MKLLLHCTKPCQLTPLASSRYRGNILGALGSLASFSLACLRYTVYLFSLLVYRNDVESGNFVADSHAALLTYSGRTMVHSEIL